MQSEAEVNVGRRRFLTRSANTVGAVGGIFVAVPFLGSWNPSERAKAAGAPVLADISKLEPGAMLTVEYRGKPVWVVDRTPEMLATLDTIQDELRDPQSEESEQPEYAKNKSRARAGKENLLVMEGVCTHLGCSPKFRPEVAAGDLGDDWQGGFYCPCHGSKFDLAGRVYSGVPAPKNLKIPLYQFVSDTEILIGDDQPKETA